MVYNEREKQFYADLRRVIILAKRGTRSERIRKELTETHVRMSRAFLEQTFTFAPWNYD